MNNVFIFNPTASFLDIQDAIEERMLKVKAITSGFLICNNQCSDLNYEILDGIFLILNDYLEEIESLYKILIEGKHG